MAQNHDSHHGSHGHHLVPIPVYFYTLLALLVLTVVTVGASYIDFGKFNIVVNIGIATVKAALVMAFFMGLKYDTNLNRAYILSSFVGLTIFIVLSATDIWVRPNPKPVAVKSAASQVTKANLNAYVTNDPQLKLMDIGKKVYDTNCVSCHGPAGKGDGVGGTSLNPKPRNFSDDGSTWTFGNSAKSIYYVLMEGSAGTGMASYKTLLPEERWALVHYVLSMGNGAKIGKADAKADAGIEAELASAGGPPKPKIPIDMAMEKVAQ
jgi:caa(3)-type oxidase subunit IV